MRYQLANLDGYSLDQLERSLLESAAAEFARAKGMTGPVVTDIAARVVEFDRNKYRVTQRFQLCLFDGNQVKVVAYGLVGKKGIVWLQCHGLNADHARDSALFETVAHSFRYVPGLEFVPGLGRPRPSSPDYSDTLLRYGPIVGLIAVIVVPHKLLAWLRMIAMRKPQSQN
jgi:hypothetical protein